MTAKTKATGRLLDAVHETARDLHTAGFIDMRRMQQYDALCRDPIPDYSSAKTRALRARHKLSQALSALTSKPSKSLHRMLSPTGNPSMDKLGTILHALRERLNVNLTAHSVAV